MSNEYDRVNTFVDRLLADKRLPRYRASTEELEAIQVAVWLRTVRPGNELPEPAFLELLTRKLHAEFEVGLDLNRVTRRGILRAAAVRLPWPRFRRHS